MAEVIIYTKKDCPYSKGCKEFLDEKKVSYTEFSINDDPARFSEMKMKTENRSDTPQVFINDHHIGSFDDLKALESTGKLNEMLDL